MVKNAAAKAADLRMVISKTLDVEVRSAVALSKEQAAAVTKALPAYAPAGNSVNVSFVVDPAVLGGLLVSMKNSVIDLSVTTKLVEVIANSRAQQRA